MSLSHSCTVKTLDAPLPPDTFCQAVNIGPHIYQVTWVIARISVATFNDSGLFYFPQREKPIIRKVPPFNKALILLASPLLIFEGDRLHSYCVVSVFQELCVEVASVVNQELRC